MTAALRLLGRAVGLLLIGAVMAYRYTLSPMLGPRCRFLPSCSEYAIEAIRLRGPLAGPALALRRIARCHPLGGSGYDPVPLPRPCPQGEGSVDRHRMDRRLTDRRPKEQKA